MSETESLSGALHESAFISLIDSSEEENRLLAEEHFTGELLKWAGNRSKLLGDFIAPKVIYIEAVGDQPHKVAWVEHNGLDTATEEKFHNHHIVCECVLCKNFNDGKGGINTSLCEVMTRALEARADIVGAEFHIATSQEYDVVNMMTGLSEPPSRFDVESMSLSAIERILRLDNLRPEAWHGNIVSGSLPVEQASRIIGQPLELTSRCAELLSRTGKVEFDGEVLSLAA